MHGTINTQHVSVRSLLFVVIYPTFFFFFFLIIVIPPCRTIDDESVTEQKRLVSGINVSMYYLSHCNSASLYVLVCDARANAIVIIVKYDFVHNKNILLIVNLFYVEGMIDANKIITALIRHGRIFSNSFALDCDTHYYICPYMCAACVMRVIYVNTWFTYSRELNFV